MDALAYLEVVDRHGDVVARHAIYGSTARIGRGYEADVILDDPYIAPEHVTLEPIGSGRFRLTDLDTQNGIVFEDANDGGSGVVPGRRVVACRRLLVDRDARGFE